MRVLLRSLCCCLYCTPAGSEVWPQSTLSDRIIKAGNGVKPFIQPASVDQLEPRTVATLPSRQESPILGWVLLASPLDSLPAGLDAMVWFVCQGLGLKPASQGCWVNIGFESMWKNVKMLSCIQFTQCCLFL